MIWLRFVQGKGFTSQMIEWRESVCMPFAPSHVECVHGGKYLGAHAEGGFQGREPGYDAPFNAETFVGLPATDQQTAAFYDAAVASIGEPYDWASILGFVLPGHHHTKFDAICSAKIFLLLRDFANWFPSKVPVVVPAHCIDPRDLLLMISAIVEVPHEPQPFPVGA